MWVGILHSRIFCGIAGEIRCGDHLQRRRRRWAKEENAAEDIVGEEGRPAVSASVGGGRPAGGVVGVGFITSSKVDRVAGGDGAEPTTEVVAGDEEGGDVAVRGK
ncbi:hypothetical protein CsatB_011223 [Cannabis sativa]